MARMMARGMARMTLRVMAKDEGQHDRNPYCITDEGARHEQLG